MSDEDRGQSVVVDDNGDVIMTGYFAGTVDFGGGPLTSNVYPWLDPNQYTDIFVVKYCSRWQSRVVKAYRWSRERSWVIRCGR